MTKDKDRCSTKNCRNETEIIHSQLKRNFSLDCWEKYCDEGEKI